MFKCSDCGKILVPEEREKTWNEFITGYPACTDCDNKILQKIEQNKKTYSKKLIDTELI